jgi:hypothetical protein
VIDQRRFQQMEDVIAAARRYRDLMRRYVREQAEMAERGVPLDELITSNWERFAEASTAEEALFASLDALDDDAPGAPGGAWPPTARLLP